MELEEALGETAVVHAFGLDDCGDDVAVAPFGQQLVEALAVELLASLAQLGEEGELVDVGDELGHGSAFLELVSAAVDIFEQGLEHARSRTRGGHELAHLAAMLEVLVPAVEGVLHLVVGEAEDTGAHTR